MQYVLQSRANTPNMQQHQWQVYALSLNILRRNVAVILLAVYYTLFVAVTFARRHSPQRSRLICARNNNMDVVRYMCPFEGCKNHFGSTNGVRHHWLITHRDHVLPELVASSMRALYVLDNTNKLQPFEPVHDALMASESPVVTDSELIVMMGLDESSASIVDVNSAGKFGRTCRFATFLSIHIEIPDQNNWLESCSAFISQCTQKIQSISVHEQLVLSDSDKTFVPVKNAADNYVYVLTRYNSLITDAALRDDIASLVQFVDCSSPCRRVANIQNVQILLLECLTDPSPKQKIQSKLLSWMIWLYQGKTQFTCPDRCMIINRMYRYKYRDC